MPLVPVIGMNIEQIFELPIAEALYFCCYNLDKIKAEQQAINEMRAKLRMK
jgi:hypothetical protein